MAMRNDDLAEWVYNLDGRVTELIGRLAQVEADNEHLRTDYDRLQVAYALALRRLLKLRSDNNDRTDLYRQP